MRSLTDMDTIQIEVTSRCINKCSNCSRFIKYYPSWDMTLDQFKEAVDSMIDYPKMIGMTGGDPILHPEFEVMCNYLHSKIPAERCGLWSCFPKGYERYRKVIVETFKHVFLNDHTIQTVMHHPFLVACDEVIKDKDSMWYMISHCKFQNSWSASINPFGAYFCEEAAALAKLFNDSQTAWKVEPGWWTRQIWDFKDQIQKWCPKCGGCVPLRMRSSSEKVDDISPENFKKLHGEVRNEQRFLIHDLKLEQDNRPTATYKDFNYRNNIAKRYGMFLIVNEQNFWTPYLYKEFNNG